MLSELAVGRAAASRNPPPAPKAARPFPLRSFLCRLPKGGSGGRVVIRRRAVKKSFSPSSRKYSSVFKGRGRRCPNSLERAPPLPSNPARRDRSDSEICPGQARADGQRRPGGKKKHFLVYRHGVKAHHIGVGQRLQALLADALYRRQQLRLRLAVPPAALPQKNPAGRRISGRSPFCSRCSASSAVMAFTVIKTYGLIFSNSAARF